MSKLLVAVFLTVVSLSAFADGSDYISPTVDFKDKQLSTNNHTVYGLTYGHDFGNSFKVEGRIEDETVNGGAHEGLSQVEVFKNIGTWYGVTPYAGAGIGLKDKSTTEFLFYRVDAGVKYAVPGVNGLSLTANTRLRTPFDEGLNLHTGYNYRTIENKISASYAIDKNNAVGISYAIERGDSEYNTVGVNYKYTF